MAGFFGGLFVGGLSNSRLFSTVLNDNQGCIIWKAERWVDTQYIGVSSQFPFALILCLEDEKINHSS